jgi:NAD dependent epimerase/dehydratase family enzyme
MISRWSGMNSNAVEVEDVIDPKALQQMDAIVHMSGEDISTGFSGSLASLGIRPWTDAKKGILNSRVVTTTALAKAIGASVSQTTFLVAFWIGVYGNGSVGQVDAVDESADIS